MKAYLEYAKNGFMDNSAHRMHVFLGAIVNVIYIVILFFYGNQYIVVKKLLMV